ncbi:MAG: uncharacterized membrane protein YbhN (UPF0104 family) [Cyclobacteriaceae bacterium]
MKAKLLSTLKYILSLSVAVGLMYWVFSGIDWKVFEEKAKEVNYWWVFFSIFISLIAYYARAYRWNILLQPMGFKNLSIHRTTLAILIGYLANLIFPRLGEVTRCGMMKRTDNVDMTNSFGTVITERLVDLLTLIVLFVFALALEYDRLMTFIEQNLSLAKLGPFNILNILMILVVVGLLGLVGLYFLFRLNVAFRNFVLNLWTGIISLKDINNVSGFLISTLVLWFVYYLMSYTIVYALPETSNLEWEVGIMLLVTGGIALSIPVQGGFGTYHTLISAMLSLYFVTRNTGVFLATLLHTSQIIATAIFGGVALAISFFIKRKTNVNTEQNI